MSEWINTDHWRNRRGATLVLRFSALLESDVIPEDAVRLLRASVACSGLAAVGGVAALVRHLLGVAVAQEWVPAGSQPMAFWIDYSRNTFMLSVTHIDMPETPEGEQFQEIVP